MRKRTTMNNMENENNIVRLSYPYVLQMYAPPDDSPSLWDMGSGHPYVEERNIPATRPHLQLTCRNCGTARWYLHRVVPVNPNPIPVFSIMSPMWEEGMVAYERVKPTEGSRPKAPVQAPEVPKAMGLGEGGRPERYGNQEQNIVNVPQPQPQLPTSTPNVNHKEVASEVLHNAVEPPINSLSAMLEPFTYETVDKPLMSPSLMTFDDFEQNNHNVIPLSPPVTQNSVVSIETVSRKEMASGGGVRTLTPKSTDGFKHLRGNTTWSPLTKRGRHGSHKSSHTSSSTNSKRSEKRSHDGRKVAASASIGHPPKV